MSHAIASSQAPARHQPRTAAMVGRGSDHSSRPSETSVESRSCQRSALGISLSTSSEMSNPAENARPAPVSTTTFTSLVGGGAAEARAQALHELAGERIELVRAVHGDPQRGPAALLEHDVAHGAPFTTTRASTAVAP